MLNLAEKVTKVVNFDKIHSPDNILWGFYTPLLKNQLFIDFIVNSLLLGRTITKPDEFPFLERTTSAMPVLLLECQLPKFTDIDT